MRSDIKISCAFDPTCPDDYLKFLEQIGIRYVYTWVTEDQAQEVFIKGLIDRLKAYGLTLYNIGCMAYGKSAEIILATDKREVVIDKFAGFIRLIGSLGIHYTTITWEPDNTLATTQDKRVAFVKTGNFSDLLTGFARGGAPARYVDTTVLAEALPVRGRRFDKEQIWEAFEYFLKRIMPVAEEADVRICLHPNDPPKEENIGLATLISCKDDYRRAFSLANSDYLGMEFCCGCWLEGGEERFGFIEESLHEFISEGRVSIVHLRNVTGSMPVFTETFLDDGIGSMPRILKTLRDLGYNGTVTYDHSPLLAGPASAYEQAALNNGYMTGVLQTLEIV